MKRILTTIIPVFIILIAGVLLYKFVFSTDNTNKQPGSQSSETENSTTDTSQTDEPETIPAADVTVYTADGTAVKLSDFYGKPIVVNFWATWCNPCTFELPAFETLYKEYGEEVHFLMFNMTDGMDETVEGVLDFINENQYSFPVYYDTDMDAAITYGITSIPRTLFIDADGNIFYGHMGTMSEESLRNYIEQLLN